MRDQKEASMVSDNGEFLAVLSETSSSSRAADEIRNDAIKAMESIFEGIKTGETIDEPKLQQTVHALIQQVLAQGEAMVEAMAHPEYPSV